MTKEGLSTLKAATARDAEASMLARCAAVARSASAGAEDQQQANVFRVAAVVVATRFPSEAAKLMRASEAYFVQNPAHQLTPAEVVRKGWVVSYPRLRDMLSLVLSTEARRHA